MTLDKKLGEVHEALVDRLLERVKTEDVSTQDLKVALELLRHNNIKSGKGTLKDLEEEVPKGFDAADYPFTTLEPTPNHQTI